MKKPRQAKGGAASKGVKLSEANPYLRDPALRKELLFISVASSSAIEGIRKPFRELAEKYGIATYSKGNGAKSPLDRTKRGKNSQTPT